MTKRATTLALAIVVAVGASPALAAKPYPTFTCASAKQKALGAYCGSALKAWSKWEKKQDDSKRDAALSKAFAKLEKSWSKAEDKSAKADVDCAEATHPTSSIGAFVDSAIGAIVDGVNDGLTLGGNDAKCGQKLLNAAAKACKGALGAYATATKKVQKSNARDKRDAKLEKVDEKLSKSFAKATGGSCTSTISEEALGAAVDALTHGLVYRSTNSASVPSDEFMMIQPNEPVTYEGRSLTAQCIDGGDYTYFVKRGTENKVLYYFQGGGACWEQLTCSIPVCKDSSGPGDNPGNVGTGFADLSNPDNPFRDWSVVFVSYCSCDIHFGDAEQNYDNFNPMSPLPIQHRGFQNSKIVEKFAREHFVNPDEVFVTGSSAGAYGAWFHAPFLHLAWPGSAFRVLADAGNGVITQDFLEMFFPNWNFIENVPPEYPEIADIISSGGGIPEYTSFVANEFPDSSWAHYTTSFDGGSGGQTGFYNLMLNDNDVTAAIPWWEGSCQFNEVMRQQAIDTAADVTTNGNDNYRYYIGSGSRHTMWGSDKVYDDTTGGVPTIVDWVDAMLASGDGTNDPDWTNVECTDCGVLLPGDVRPPGPPYPAPFTGTDPDVFIDCPGTP